VSEDLHLYLRVLAAEAKPGEFFDLRWMRRGGTMRRAFIGASRPDRAGRLIERLSARADVYVGVALRAGRVHGGKGAIGGSQFVHVERDTRDSARRLARFAHPPTLEIASGTPGHLHLYWRLQRRAGAREIESANRRLARALGGDEASVDITRVLRAPETLNHKHDPPSRVRLLVHRELARYELEELIAGLEDPAPAPAGREAPPSRTATRSRRDRELLAIAAPEYVRALTGKHADRSGKLACPFHEDRTPSLQLYGDGTFYCFGCKRGGTIFDFASQLWSSGTRGREFLALRERLAECFGVDHAGRR
jgi:hypothetical protein